MTAEKKPFGDEWYKHQLEIEELKIAERVPILVQDKIDCEKLKENIVDMKAKHCPPPPKSPAPINTKKEKRHKPTKKELRTEKKYHQKMFDLEGPRGVHTIMQKRPAPYIEAPNPRDKIVLQEIRDKNRMYPPKRGYRLWEAPDIVFPKKTDFAAYSDDLIGLSEEERINLLLENSEKYDIRQKYRHRG